MKRLLFFSLVALCCWSCKQDEPTPNNHTVPVSSISLDKPTIEMVEGEKTTLKATITPSDASNKNISWVSSNDNVVSVSGGELSAKMAGMAVITATAGEKSATCNVTVTKKVIHVESISTNVAHKRLKVGEEYSIKVSVLPENANNYSISYSSTNANVAAVSNDGIVIGKATGSTTITIEAEGKNCEVPIKVFEKDIVYAIVSHSPNGNHSSYLYKNQETVLSANNYRFKSVYLIDNQPSIVANSFNAGSRGLGHIIVDGTYTPINVGPEANCGYLEYVTQAGNDVYSIIMWHDSPGNYKYGIWKNLDMLYDLGTEMAISSYSVCYFSGLSVKGDDIYVFGSIVEPISETSTVKYAVVWKNKQIFKQWDVRDSNATWGGEVTDMLEIDGQYYYLIGRSSQGGTYKWGIYNDGGKVYGLCEDAEYVSPQIYAYDGKIYASVWTANHDYSELSVRIYENNTLLYTIPDANDFASTLIDGDIYTLIDKKRVWGGTDYHTMTLYRNDKQEYTLGEESTQFFETTQVLVTQE